MRCCWFFIKINICRSCVVVGVNFGEIYLYLCFVEIFKWEFCKYEM